MFGETTIFYEMIWNHPVETTIKNWLFGVPGRYHSNYQDLFESRFSRYFQARVCDVSEPAVQLVANLSENPSGKYDKKSI